MRRLYNVLFYIVHGNPTKSFLFLVLIFVFILIIRKFKFYQERLELNNSTINLLKKRYKLLPGVRPYIVKTYCDITT